MANAGKPTAHPLTPAAGVALASNGSGGGGGPDDLYQALQDLAKELDLPYDFKSDAASMTTAVRECLGAVQKMKNNPASNALGKGSSDNKYTAPSGNGQSSSATPSSGPTPLELAVSYDFDLAKENATKPKEERKKNLYWKEADSVYILLGDEKAEDNLAEQLCGVRCRLGTLIKEARANSKANKNLAYGLQRVLNGPQPKDDRTQADCKKYAASKRTDTNRVSTAAADLQDVAAKFALCTENQTGAQLWAAATAVVPSKPTTPDVPKEKKKKSPCSTVCDCAK